MDYGLRAVFGCPAHDQRDLDFARKYNLNVTPVVKPINEESIIIEDKAYADEGELINSKFLNGLKVPNESIPKTIEFLEEKELGKNKLISDLKVGNFKTKILGMSNSYSL